MYNVFVTYEKEELIIGNIGGYIPSTNSNLELYLFKFEYYVFIYENIKILDIYK
jgi:hypothetical protein